jgi:D-inositol-3-phosphate glycosyltransferase
MKVLIVTHYFKPHIGGIEIVAYNQAKELVKRGHTVTIVTSRLNREKIIEQKEEIRIVRVAAWNLFEEKFDVPYPIFSPRLVSTINKEMKQCDVIHAHGVLYLGSFVSSVLARIYKKPFFLTEHVGFVIYKNPVINTIEKIALRTVGAFTIKGSCSVIVLNNLVYKIIRQYKNKVHYLPNGVDFNLFHKPTEQEKQAIRERYNIPLAEFVVLFVGRFVPKKGFDILYNARDPSYHLVFVSGGTIPKYIKPDNSVTIIGSLPQEELAMLYKASDVFILPSYGEGFPLSIQEAMATELPIITSKHNKLDQIPDSPFISYIDVTEKDIKCAIRKIQNNVIIQSDMAEYSGKIAKENFSWEKNTIGLLNIYQIKGS